VPEGFFPLLILKTAHWVTVAISLPNPSAVDWFFPITQQVIAVASRRKDDGAKFKNWFRTDRMFEDNGGWFFFTREGTIEGPFINPEQTNIGLEIYISSVCTQYAAG
jgi:hypothetical protein